MTGPIAASRLSTWRIVNVGTVEGVGRIAVGVAATIAGVVLRLSAARPFDQEVPDESRRT